MTDEEIYAALDRAHRKSVTVVASPSELQARIAELEAALAGLLDAIGPGTTDTFDDFGELIQSDHLKEAVAAAIRARAA